MPIISVAGNLMSFIQLKIKIAYIRNFTCIKPCTLHTMQNMRTNIIMQTDDFATLQFIYYSFQFNSIAIPPPGSLKKKTFRSKLWKWQDLSEKCNQNYDFILKKLYLERVKIHYKHIIYCIKGYVTILAWKTSTFNYFNSELSF